MENITITMDGKHSSDANAYVHITQKPENVTTGGPVPFIEITKPVCQWILYAKINNSRVRVWDLAIFIPNILFLLFLLWKFRDAIAKLHASSSPIFTTFYVLVLSVSGVSILRCVVSMTVDATTKAGDNTDKVLWLVLRFFLLATELSVVIFGLAFGHLDSRTSIQRVLIVTCFIALIYSVTQGVLELKDEHQIFTARGSEVDNGTTTNFNLFAHGGMIFFFTSSLINFAVYTIIVILPFTRLRERFQLPTKRLFYYYCVLLACLNLAQALAALLLYLGFNNCLCAIDATTYIYFTLFNPLMYGVFLWKFFTTSSSGVQFSYRHQENVVDDDHLALPHGNSINNSSKHDDNTPIFSYDSSHFDVQLSHSPNMSYMSRPAISVNSEPHYNVVT